MGLKSKDVNDFVQNALKELGKARFTDIVTGIQRHVALRSIMQRSRIVFPVELGKDGKPVSR